MQGSKINSILTIEYMCNEKENQFFDRKSAKKDVKELANHIAGFANASGGTLVIGIADNGKIEGFDRHRASRAGHSVRQRLLYKPCPSWPLHGHNRR